MQVNQRSSIAVIVVLETALLFSMGVLSSRLSNLLAISSGLLLILILMGLAALAAVSYKKFTYHTTGKDLKVDPSFRLRQLAGSLKGILSAKPTLTTNTNVSRQEEERLFEAAEKQAMVRGIAGSIVLAFTLPLVTNTLSLLIWAVVMVLFDWFASRPILVLPSSETGSARLGEFLGVMFFTGTFYMFLPFGVVGVILALCGWL